MRVPTLLLLACSLTLILVVSTCVHQLREIEFESFEYVGCTTFTMSGALQIPSIKPMKQTTQC